jgi:hypothetical protein
MRQGDPDGASVDKELDINGIGVAGGYGNDQRLVNAMDLFFGPAVAGVEIAIHGCKNYSGGMRLSANGEIR